MPLQLNKPDIHLHDHELTHTFTVTRTLHHAFQTSLVGSSPFRERLGSNRLPEKPRPRFELRLMISTLLLYADVML